MQILLGELSPKLDRNEKKLLKLLGHIRKRAGKVRDLDVQLAALRSLKIPREPRRKTQLIHQLIDLRSQQEKKLRKEANQITVREIRKRLKRAAKHFNPETGRDPLVVAQSMSNDPCDDARDRAVAPIPNVLHQYRILTKRARYAAEFASPSKEAVHFVAEMKRIQDALGDWHDWLTLTYTASERLGGVRESPLVAELHNVTGAKFRHGVAVLSSLRTKPPSKSEPAVKAPAQPPATATRATASAA